MAEPYHTHQHGIDRGTRDDLRPYAIILRDPITQKKARQVSVGKSCRAASQNKGVFAVMESVYSYVSRSAILLLLMPAKRLNSILIEHKTAQSQNPLTWATHRTHFKESCND